MKLRWLSMITRVLVRPTPERFGVWQSVLSCLVLVAAGLASSVKGDEGGDPQGARNRAATSSLPSGQGLAARYVGDLKLAGDDNVIFAESFEAGNLEQWDEVRDKDQRVLRFVDPGQAGLGERCLQVTADLEHNTGGGATIWFESSETLFIRFYVKFAADCDYVHHFATLRANRGLTGGDRWSGFGGAGALPDGEQRFSTALEPWGDWRRSPPPGRWNFYSYWHEMSASGDGKYWGNAFRPAKQTDIPRDRWICCEIMLKHNDPAQANGEQAYWIDGELRGHWTGIHWRTSERLQANAFTLESYVTNRWTKQRYNRVWFDQLVIAREYIGPLVVEAAEPSSGR